MTEENFANAPYSITELRADKEGDGKLWTVRDALVSLLRDIDSGKTKATKILMFYGMEGEDGVVSAKYSASGMHFHELVGFLEICKYDMLLK